MGDESKMDVVVDADEEQEQMESKLVKNTLPWVEKYRPKSLGDLIAHEEIIQILNKLIDSNKLPHLLFYGPPGTGTHTAQRTTCVSKVCLIEHPISNYHISHTIYRKP
jgi:replication-associated recombination protein RarA